MDRAVFFEDDTRIAAAWTETYPGEAMLSYITIWDTESGEIISEMGGIAGWVVGLAASPDGKQLALYNYEGAILVWDAEGEAQILTDQHPAIGETLAVHGDTLAVGGFDRGVRLWSLSERELIATLYAHNSSVTAVAFSPDGLLASASLFDTWTWDAVNGIRDIDLPPFAPLALSFDGETVYGAAGRQIVELWSSSPEGVETHWLEGVVASLGAAAAGRTAIYTEDGAIILYNIAGEELTRFTPDGEIAHLRMSPDGALLFVGGVEDAALWKIDGTPKRIWSMTMDSRVITAAFSPDGRLIAVGTPSGTLEVRSREDGALIAVTNLPYYFYGVAFSPDSSTVIGALNTQLFIWEIQ
jgi:WD40 repeat protein